MNQKTICSIGLIFFVISYILFSLGPNQVYFQEPIDLHTGLI